MRGGLDSNAWLFCLAALFLSCSEREKPAALPQPPPVEVRLPHDDGPHQSLLEWWYWAGQLTSGDGRRFGFHLVFFELRPLGVDFQFTHHTIADIEEKNFRFRIERGRKIASGSAAGIDLAHGDMRAKGAAGRDRLHAVVDEYRLELELKSLKAPVLHHRGGFLEYPFGGSTHYYSRTRLAAKGTLRIGERVLPVAGSAWFDHQWGEMGEIFEQSWDWFGIQLDDGRELMIFRMRVGGAEKLRGGTYVPEKGPAESLAPAEIEIIPRGQWRSPHSGCVYPLGWQIRARGLELELAAVLEGQELWSNYPRYWEGLAEVSGSASGKAFIELNNYCR